MSRSSYNLKPCATSERRDYPAQARDVGSRLLNIFADARANFYLRLNHLRLNLLAQNHLPLFKKFRDMRAQLSRLRVNYLKLFFYPQRELIEHRSPPS